MTGSRKKILYLIQLPPPVHGVSQMNHLIFHSKIINEGFEKKLIPLNFSKKFSEIRKFNLKKIVVFFSICIKLIITLATFRPHLVYFSFMPLGSGFIRDFVYAVIIKASRARPIYHIHNRGIERNSQKWIYRKMYEFVFRKSTIIHLSEKLAQSELKNIKLVDTRIVIQPNTVDNFSSTRKPKKNRNEIRLLFFSNLLPQKGLMTLLQAISMLRKMDLKKNILLDVYGDYYRKAEIDRYKKYIKENHLDDVVTLHGPCYGREKEKAFLRSDIFVFPSYFEEECFPLVILEAMQASLGIISTRIGAIPEILRDNENTIFFEKKNIKELSFKLSYVINNKSLIQKKGTEYRSLFYHYYDIINYQNRFKQILA